MSRTRPPRRALVAAASTLVAATVAAVLVFAGPSAVAAIPDESGAGDTGSESRPAESPEYTVPGYAAYTSVTAVPGAGSIALGPISGLAGAAAARAQAAAVSLAEASTPEPPPRTYCPVPASEFVDSWGFARSGGRRHKGVDMMAPYGSPIFAPVAGEVRSSNSALGGLGFYLVDGDGNQYFGSHLATLEASGWVEAGDRIGSVGTSGNAHSPHLHFEVAPGGGASTNPYPYALAWCLQDPNDPWSAVPTP